MAPDEGIKGVSSIAVSAGTRRGYSFPIVRLARRPKTSEANQDTVEETKTTPSKNSEEKSEGVDITV